MQVHGKQTRDRRIQKTRRLLFDAFGTLLLEKRYESIVVREILDRANVGRSTFYAHFRDKDALLVSAIRDILAAAPEAPSTARHSENLIRFSRPLFEHIARHLRGGKGRMGLRTRATVHDRLRQVLAERLTEDVATVRSGAASGGVPSELLVQHVTATFVTVLNWWVESRSKLSPGEVDDVFRALVLPSLSVALD
jgi:AcrR family transcriptional regulator